jgi:TonB family protein
MQPREPQWDKPALGGRAILGCALLMAVAAASGVGFWLIRSGQVRLPDLDRPSAAKPTPTIAAPTTIEAAAPAVESPPPAPESSPFTADSLQKEIDQQVQQKIREMQSRLEKGTVEGAWAPAPSSGEPPLDVRRVGGEIEPPRLISRVQPKYPEGARLARVQGVVILEAVIDARGEVMNLRVLKGLPLGLDAAAVEAVKQWKFAPATLHGKPVAVYYVLTVNFKLE